MRRCLKNSFLDTWHGDNDKLAASLPEAIQVFYEAVAAEDFDSVAILVGEAVGIVRQIRPAADIVADMARDAARILKRGACAAPLLDAAVCQERSQVIYWSPRISAIISCSRGPQYQQLRRCAES